VERFQTLGSWIFGIREGDAVQRRGEARLSAGVSLESVPEMGNCAAPVPVALRGPVVGKRRQHAVRLNGPAARYFLVLLVLMHFILFIDRVN
jgi:hypothetical protein